MLWPLPLAKPPGVSSPPTVVLLGCETPWKNATLIGKSFEMPLLCCYAIHVAFLSKSAIWAKPNLYIKHYKYFPRNGVNVDRASGVFVFKCVLEHIPC